MAHSNNNSTQITSLYFSGSSKKAKWYKNTDVLQGIIALTIFVLGIAAFILYLLTKNSGSLGTPETITNTNKSENNVTQTIPPTNSTTAAESSSIDSLFKYYDPTSDENSSKPAGSENFTLIATGDIIPARSVNAQMTKLNNFKYPFEKTLNILKSGDALFINLEAPLIENCPVRIDGMVFCGSPRFIEGLNYAGVKVANIANNHFGNYGADGINKTVELLNKNGIQVDGNGQTPIITHNGRKYGFIGYSSVAETAEWLANADDPEKIKLEIAELKKIVDFVVVAFHWGNEYTSDPTDRQTMLAHTAVDAGADLVIGNHPHWVQAVETYKGKYIFYALGNFVFDQMWSNETKEGVIAKIQIGNNGVSDIKLFPTVIENYVQPRFANKAEAENILGRMKEASYKLNYTKK